MSELQPKQPASVSSWYAANGWRQGSVLPEGAGIALHLFPDRDKKYFAMIVTHDCDCVADVTREPRTEIVVGTVIKKLDGTFTHAKSTRKHISNYRNATNLSNSK